LESILLLCEVLIFSFCQKCRLWSLTPYGLKSHYDVFSSVEQLMADFWSDVRTLRGGK